MSSSSSWTQVYITGLNRSISPSDEEIEIALDLRFGLSSIIHRGYCSGGRGSTKSEGSRRMVAGVAEEEEGGRGGSSRGWAGYGTTIIKRLTNDDRCCRGYAFLSFFTREAALIAIERINNSEYCNNKSDDVDDESIIHGVVVSNHRLPKLRAEMVNNASSTTSTTKERKQRNGNTKNDDETNNASSPSLLPDLRLKRRRKKPIGKHPVIISSNGRRTNLGNKTK